MSVIMRAIDDFGYEAFDNISSGEACLLFTLGRDHAIAERGRRDWPHRRSICNLKVCCIQVDHYFLLPSACGQKADTKEIERPSVESQTHFMPLKVCSRWCPQRRDMILAESVEEVGPLAASGGGKTRQSLQHEPRVIISPSFQLTFACRSGRGNV